MYLHHQKPVEVEISLSNRVKDTLVKLLKKLVLIDIFLQSLFLLSFKCIH